MINFDAFTRANCKFRPSEFPFIKKQIAESVGKKDLEGIKILHNIPLTLEAVLKIEPLLLRGADLTVSCISVLNPNPEAIEILRGANVKIQIPHVFLDSYDICMDCCGELLNIVTPHIGTVELTKTGTDIYKSSKTSYPVISVDDSSLKMLETSFGTGDAFVRALKEIGV